MSKEALRIFFSSPSDCEEYFEGAKKCIEQFNDSYMTDDSKPIFQIFNYKTVIPSQFSGDAQSVIDGILFPRDKPIPFQFYLGILKNRFGQPIGEYQSGTEAEFKQAIETLEKEEVSNLKGVSFLFYQGGLEDTSDEALDQKKKVNHFQKEISPKGLYKFFKDDPGYWREINLLLTSWAKLKSSSIQSVLSVGKPSFQKLQVSNDFLAETINSIDSLIWLNSSAKTLNDVWVEPKMILTSPLRGEGVQAEKDVTLTQIVTSLCSGASINITGSEGSGKTVISRRVFSEILSKNSDSVPVLLKGEDIRHSDKKDIKKRVFQLLSYQYSNVSLEDARKIDPKRIILIVDDISTSKISSEEKGELIKECYEEFYSCLFLGRDTENFESLNPKKLEEEVKRKIKRIEVHRPKKEKMDTMIRRWIKLHNVDIASELDEERQVSEYFNHLKRIFDGGFLERNFFNILLILRTLRNDSLINKSERGDIFYYSLLIASHLEQNLERKEIETAEEFLLRLGWYQLKNSVSEVSESSTDEILEEWAQINGLKIADLYRVFNRLLDIHVLEKREDKISFKQAYVACYYEARIFYKNLSLDKVEANKILGNFQHQTWTRKSAMTLEFFAALDHGERAIDLVVSKIKLSFQEHQKIEIQDSCLITLGEKSLAEGKKYIPFDKPARKDRSNRLKKEDKLGKENLYDREKLNERLSEVEELFSSIKVAGNLLRENYMTFPVEKKRDLIRESISAMRRLVYLSLNELSSFSQQLNEEDDKDKRDDLQKSIKLFSCIVLFFSMLRITESLGDKIIDYSIFYDDDDDPFHKLYLLSCNIETHDDEQIDCKNLSSLLDAIRGKYIVFAALRHVVLRRLELRRPKLTVRQRLCNLVGFSYKAPPIMGIKADR